MPTTHITDCPPGFENLTASLYLNDLKPNILPIQNLFLVTLLEYYPCLKSLFYKQYFFSECNSEQLPTFFTHFWVGLLLLCCCTHPKVSEKSGQMVRVAFGKEVLLVKQGLQVVLVSMSLQLSSFLTFQSQRIFMSETIQ